MFRSGDTWRHISSLDVDIYIAKVTYFGTRYIKARVYYFNRNAFFPENRLISTRPDTVKIQRKDFWKWTLV